MYVFECDPKDGKPETGLDCPDAVLTYMTDGRFDTGYRSWDQTWDPYMRRFTDAGEIRAYSDGRWYWDTRDIFLVREYAARPRREFLEWIASQR